MKTLKIIGIVLAVLIVLIALLVFRILTAPMVPSNYTKTAETGGTLEAAYLAAGPYKVKYWEEQTAEPLEKYEVYYPEALEQEGRKYPAVVFVNGTGVLASKYKALFRHLASWGFIVLGNKDPSTWTGQSADQTLAYIAAESSREGSIFHNRVDLENIGISGHSQGGAGVFNAITAQEHSALYKTAVALSPTCDITAAALGWTYDLAEITIPTLLLAGANDDFETQMVIPLEAMERMYEQIPAPKVMARKASLGHGQTLYAADGYVTAWFLWHLQGDAEAAAAFTGESPEILRNPLYQDQRLAVDQG